MKQDGDVWLLVPKKSPKTLRGVQSWHRRLLETAVHLEFEQKSLKGAQEVLNSEIRRYASCTKDPAVGGAARMALTHLNDLKQQNTKRLREVSARIKMVHDTNEVVLRILLEAHGAEETTRSIDARGPKPGSNLLHGVGWLYEVATADYLSAQGQAAFVTFGSVFDPAGFDVISFPRARQKTPLDLLTVIRAGSKKPNRALQRTRPRRRTGPRR